MKKRFLNVVLLIDFIICSCSSNKLLATDENFLKIMNKNSKYFNYEIDTSVEGNFTNSNYNEMLVFFYGQEKKGNAKSKKSLVFIIDDENRILNVYNPMFSKRPVSDINFIKEIDKFNITFDNAVITDFNKNGVLEFIYFSAAGSVYEFLIEEFKNGQFAYICQTYNPELKIPGLYNYDLDHFDFEEKSLYLHSRINNEKIKLKWNPETQFYDKVVLSE